MFKIGEKVELDFEVKYFADGEKQKTFFRDLITGPTIVSVYMRNNTGSCDKQIDSLVAASKQIAALGYNIIGVSRDTSSSHEKFAAKKGVEFTLVSDPKFQFAYAVDSVVEKSMYGRKFLGPTRSAYLLSKEGILEGIIEKVDSASHGDQLIEVLSK